MYLQITSKCNMLCDHCCGDYGPEGEDSPIVGNVWEGIGTEKYPYATYDDCWKNWEEIEEYAS